jgi:tellurite resistance protein TerC
VNHNIYLALLVASTLCLLAFDSYSAWREKVVDKSLIRSALFSSLYILLAIGAGLMLPHISPVLSQENFYSTWIAEYSLSFDNLLVFFLIFKRLGVVPKEQELVLFFGIGCSYVMRAATISLGIAVVDHMKFANAIFGAFIIYSALEVFGSGDDEWEESRALRFLRSKRYSQMVISIAAVAFADLLFAFDSIPAALSISNNIKVILIATFFALMGLRHLYFLIEAIAEHIKYLNVGVSVLLALLGVKLIMQSVRDYGVHKLVIVPIPAITAKETLAAIVFVLFLATLVSWISNVLSIGENTK